MEDIEYLEEYENIVKPTVDSVLLNSRTKTMTSLNDDDDSSSIDQDMFESLFNDHSDESSFPEREITKTKRRNERDSVDSFDMLMKDFGEQLSDDETQKKTATSISALKPKYKGIPKDPAVASKIVLSTALDKRKDPAQFGKTKSIATVRPTIQNQQKSAQPSTVKRTIITNKFHPKKTPNSQHVMQNAATSSQPALTKLVTSRSNMSSSSKLLGQAPTIIRPEKPLSKDPSEDPLSLEPVDDFDSDSDSDSFTLSDVTDEDSMGSLSDWDNALKDEFEILTNTNSRKNPSRPSSVAPDIFKPEKGNTASKQNNLPVKNNNRSSGTAVLKSCDSMLDKRGFRGPLKRFSDDFLNLFDEDRVKEDVKTSTIDISNKEQSKTHSKLETAPKGHGLEATKSPQRHDEITCRSRNIDITKNSTVAEIVTEIFGSMEMETLNNEQTSSHDVIDTQNARGIRTSASDSDLIIQEATTETEPESTVPVKCIDEDKIITEEKSIEDLLTSESGVVDRKGTLEIKDIGLNKLNEVQLDQAEVHRKRILKRYHLNAPSEKSEGMDRCAFRNSQNVTEDQNKASVKGLASASKQTHHSLHKLTIIPKGPNSIGTDCSELNKTSNTIMQKMAPITMPSCLVKFDPRTKATVREKLQDEFQVEGKTSKKRVTFLNVTASKPKLTSTTSIVPQKRKLSESVSQVFPKKTKSSVSAKVDQLIDENVKDNDQKAEQLYKLSKQKEESAHRISPCLPVEDSSEKSENLDVANRISGKEDNAIGLQLKTEEHDKISERAKSNENSSTHSRNDISGSSDKAMLCNNITTESTSSNATNPTKVLSPGMKLKVKSFPVENSDSDSIIPDSKNDIDVIHNAISNVTADTKQSEHNVEHQPTATSPLNLSSNVLNRRFKLKELRVRLDRRIANLYMKNVRRKQCDSHDSDVEQRVTKSQSNVTVSGNQNQKKPLMGSTNTLLKEELIKSPSTQSEVPAIEHKAMVKLINNPNVQMNSVGQASIQKIRQAEDSMQADARDKGQLLATSRAKVMREKKSPMNKLAVTQGSKKESKGSQLSGKVNSTLNMKSSLSGQSLESVISNSKNSSPNAPLSVVDANGIKIYSFLYPAEKNKNHEGVLLDYCCPNLDGPMPVIDPTRIHKQTQKPCQELPAFIVMTTKVITRSELEANSNAIPASIRQKVEKIKASTGTGPSTATIISPSKTINSRHLTSAVVQRSSSESNNVNEASIPQKSKKSSVPEVSESKPDFKETQLRSALRKYDATLKKYSPSFMDISFSERQEIIEKIITAAEFTKADIDIAIRLLDEYGKQTGMIHSLPTTSIALQARTTTPISNSNKNKTTTSEQNSELRNKKTKKSNLKKQVPIYDADKNIIGYQLQKAPAPKVSPTSKVSHAASANRSLKESLDKKKESTPFVVKLPIQQPPRIFYTKVSTAQLTVSPSTLPVTMSSNMSENYRFSKDISIRPIIKVNKQTRDTTNVQKKTQDLEPTRTSYTLDDRKVVTSKQTVVQVLESSLSRPNRKTIHSNKLIVITNAGGNSDVGECILPDDTNTTKIKTEKEDDFIG